ncbi:hypothetical protein POM88_039487 [Heracleum sosnowskyi]|uniref:Reverse transcriptase zinc-binding domain-containing protein n=1 Tax=Heracleum sosnowskyi TaxID=360622 RepID=A0AAD8HCB5_9APIA|nr:hypothetical protein POM88_039487 [Heracleum sosnowskyi]
MAFNHSDSCLWHYNKNGCYTVRSGYNLALRVDRERPSSSSEIPRKILTFGWRGFPEILPTTKGLHRRNVVPHSGCPLCGFGEDSNAHAVFWCPFAQEVWALLEYPFLVGPKEDISFKDVLFYATELLERVLFDKLLINAWGIWSERNKKTHGQLTRSPLLIKIWLYSYYDEIKDTRIREVGFSTGEEFPIGDQVEVEIQDIKLFVDASISTDTQMVGLGAVIISANKKKILAALSKPLSGTLSVFHTEALALLVSLRWAQEVGLPIKIISSDSLSLVQALNSESVYQNELGFSESLTARDNDQNSSDPDSDTTDSFLNSEGHEKLDDCVDLAEFDSSPLDLSLMISFKVNLFYPFRYVNYIVFT